MGDAEDFMRYVERFMAEVPAMEATLAHVDERYGGAAAYLRSGGLSPADLDLIRANLLDPR